MVDRLSVARAILGSTRVTGNYRGARIDVYINPRRDGGVFMKVGDARVVLDRRNAAMLAVALMHSIYVGTLDGDVLEWAWSVVHEAARGQQHAQQQRTQQRRPRRQQHAQRAQEADDWFSDAGMTGGGGAEPAGDDDPWNIGLA